MDRVPPFLDSLTLKYNSNNKNITTRRSSHLDEVGRRMLAMGASSRISNLMTPTTCFVLFPAHETPCNHDNNPIKKSTRLRLMPVPRSTRERWSISLETKAEQSKNSPKTRDSSDSLITVVSIARPTGPATGSVRSTVVAWAPWQVLELPMSTTSRVTGI